MQQSSTPHSNRVHILLLGRCNSGKSALINAITGQQVAIVSTQAGTTTDPVVKAAELPNIGAAVLIDTAGIDDSSPLGAARIAQTRRMLDKADIVLYLVEDDITSLDEEWLGELHERKVPTIIVLSKCDSPNSRGGHAAIEQRGEHTIIRTSATSGEGIEQLLAAIATLQESESHTLTEGLCERDDMVLLVMPQDSQAPKGRLILPQVQTLRELLDRGCNAICCTPHTISSALQNLQAPPALIITDSQIFDQVAALRPASSRLTSFSILQARSKGDIARFVEGAAALDRLTPTARILIAEACTHRPQNEDIGRVQLPRMLRRKLGDKVSIDVVSGNDFPSDLSPYDLIIHCGACMFNRRHVLQRIAAAEKQSVPITNYGVAIAALTGILDKVDY